VYQNHSEEEKREKEFWDLQDAILKEFGHASPEPPKLSVRLVYLYVVLSFLTVDILGTKRYADLSNT